ncbi:MAG: hypothetical protein LBQ10_02930 [Desulfovibrio sp.]|jgi:hypothetical protein|nr:hypothetical protein [Desulfovibrio sp.]
MKGILTERRRAKLADYMLNMSVACFAVAAFEGKPWGIIPAVLALGVFFILTKED